MPAGCKKADRHTSLYLVVLLVGILAIPGAALAQDTGRVFAVRGVGQLPCKALSEIDDQQQSPLPYLIAGWIDGYVTALNRRTDATFDLLPWQHTDFLIDLLTQHCARFPDRAISRAVQAMTTAMNATKLASKSDLVWFDTPGGQAQIYRDVLRLAQTKLAKRGHYTATIDGLFGPRTQAAISAFQKEMGLPDDGLPDQVTLWRLFEHMYETN